MTGTRDGRAVTRLRDSGLRAAGQRVPRTATTKATHLVHNAVSGPEISPELSRSSPASAMPPDGTACCAGVRLACHPHGPV